MNQRVWWDQAEGAKLGGAGFWVAKPQGLTSMATEERDGGDDDEGI
jgi:hypothetical protein